MISIIGFAIAAFLLLFGLHVAALRCFKPKSEDNYVFLHYIIFPGLIFIGLLLSPLFPGVAREQAVISYLLYFVISASWVASYPAIYADCPTLVIAMIIYKSRQGISMEALRDLLDLKANSMERIGDAALGGLIQCNKERLYLTRTGVCLSFLFRFYRRVLGLRIDFV